MDHRLEALPKLDGYHVLVQSKESRRALIILKIQSSKIRTQSLNEFIQSKYF